MNEARSDHRDGRFKHRRSDTFAAAIPWSLWALSVVPLIVLFVEFGEPSGTCGVGAGFYAKLYGHIFVYPIAFGLLI